MTSSLPRSDQQDLRVIQAIVEDAVQIVKSSTDDWADVIGDELIALEIIRRLEREKRDLKSTLEISSERDKGVSEIQELETQIGDLRSKLPPDLLIISRQVDDDNQDIISAIWLAERHLDQNGFQFKVVAGERYSDETDPDKIDLEQKMIIRKARDNALDVHSASGLILGRVLNPLPYFYDHSVRILERCYGKCDLEVEYVGKKTKYKSGGMDFMHYVVRILNPPLPEVVRQRIVIKD